MAAIDLDPPLLRAIVRDACAVARGLARANGRRQFYTLAQVQSQAAACSVDAARLAWIDAVFVSRDDFEAFFAVRETPGTYGELRSAMSPPEPHGAPPPMWDVGRADDDEPGLSDLWDFLSLAADA